MTRQLQRRRSAPPCSVSSLFGIGCVGYVLEKAGEYLTVGFSALAHLGFYVFLLQCYGSAEGLEEPWSVGKIPLAHSELRTDLPDSDVIGNPRILWGVIRGGGSLDTTASPDYQPEELAPTDLGFAIEDRLTHPSVPILSEIVTEEHSEQAGSNGDKECCGRCHDLIWIQIAGGIIGIGLGCLLISLPNVKGQARREGGSK